MRIVTAEEVAAATPWPALIDALAAAFADPASVTAPPRAHHTVKAQGDPDRTLLIMPAWDARGATVVKLVTVVPGNGARGLPAIQGQVLVSDPATGAWTALIDGGALTERRTAAASALAARHLARADARTLFMVGTGRLSQALIAAHASVRPVARVLVWGRTAEKAESVAAWARAQGYDAQTAALEDGARQADVISCATLSAEPLIEGAWLRPGVHLDLVGAFRATMRETDAEAVARSAVFVDTMAGARGEAGDLLLAAREGRFSLDAIRADLHALCAGAHPGREGADQITLFKSVGASLEDFVAARMVAEALA